MRKIIAALAVVTLGASLTACTTGQSAPDAAPESGGSLSLALIQAPASFAPGDLKTGPSAQFFQPVYDSLIRNDNDGEPQPSIATEWSYNDDMTVLSLALQDGITFTDGEPVDGDAVKANLEFAKGGTGEAAGQLRFLKEVTVVDATHVDLVLSAVDPSFLPNLGSVGGMLASPAELETGTLATKPIGSGPYVLDDGKTQPGSKYVYTRNQDYWNAEGFPYDEISITVFNDNNAVLNALRAGQVDSAVIGPKDGSAIEAADMKVEKFPAYTSSGLYLFDREGTLVPALADVRVRQAINYALDREAIRDQAYAGDGTPTAQQFSINSTAYVAELDERYPYDVDKAKSLLAEAGYADGFVLPMPDVAPIYPQQQAAVTEALTAIGITPDYQPVNGQTFIADLLGAKYPAAIFNLDANRAWDTTQIALSPEALWNTFHVNDPKIVSLINKAQTETGDTQAATFQELNKYVVEQAWFAPWIQSDNVFAVAKDVNVESQKYSTFPPIWNYTPAS